MSSVFSVPRDFLRYFMTVTTNNKKNIEYTDKICEKRNRDTFVLTHSTNPTAQTMEGETRVPYYLHKDYFILPGK